MCNKILKNIYIYLPKCYFNYCLFPEIMFGFIQLSVQKCFVVHCLGFEFLLKGIRHCFEDFRWNETVETLFNACVSKAKNPSVWTLFRETCCWSFTRRTKHLSQSQSKLYRIYTDQHNSVYFHSIWFHFILSDVIIRYLCAYSPSQVVQTGSERPNCVLLVTTILCAAGFRLSHLQAPVGWPCDEKPPVSSNRGEPCQQMFKTFAPGISPSAPLFYKCPNIFKYFLIRWVLTQW